MKFDALVDSGATISALPLWLYQRIVQRQPEAVTEIPDEITRYTVTVATADKTRPVMVATIKVTLSDEVYSEKFLILRRMSGPILGNSFLIDHDLWLYSRGKLLKSPALTYQLNMITTEEGKKKRVKTGKGVPVETSTTITIPPGRYETVTCKIPADFAGFHDTTGVVVEFSPFARTTRSLAVTSALSSIDKIGKTVIGMVNIGTRPVTIPADTRVATLEILTPEQARYLAPIDPAVADKVSKIPDLEVSKVEFNQLICNKAVAEEGLHWFPTPETCKDPSKLEGPMLRIYNELTAFKKAEKLDPKLSPAMRAEFLANFKWKDTVFNAEQKRIMEALLVEFNDIFSRHRWDVGGNDEMQVKLTPEHDEPVFKRSPPTPIHYKDDLMVELAIMQYFGIIAPLSASKYSSPIFCQRKSNGRLRILIDLRRINHLIRHDYDEFNFPIANMADAVAHVVGKIMFSKFDCRHAYYAVRMADQRSIQLLSFNFASRTFAFQRLAQGLSRSVSAFSAIMIHYLQKCIAQDDCHAFVDDILAGSKNFESHIKSIRNVFTAIRKCGIKFAMEKCEFGVTKVKYLGSVVTTDGVLPNEEKIEGFLKTVKIPTTVHKVQQFVGFVNFFANYIPNCTMKMVPFYRHIKENAKKLINTDDHYRAFAILKHDLAVACRTTLRLPMAGKQFILLTDASFDGAGYVLMIEDYTDPDNEKRTKKKYAPVAFGSKVFKGAHRKASIFAKEFLAVHFAFETFAHILWGTSNKPILVLTDNAGLSSFFQAKTIPPSLWNYMDHVLSFRWVIGHIPGKANPAADYLSRMHEDPNTPLYLTMQGRVPAHDIIIDMDSERRKENGKEPEECDAQYNKWEKDSFQKKTRKNAETNSVIFTINVMYAEPELSPEMEMLNVLAEENPEDKYDFSHKTNVLDMIAEQRKDKDIVEVKRWITDKTIPFLKYGPINLTKYYRQLGRLHIQRNILKRDYYDHAGKITHHQICVPEHLIPELLNRIHNSKTQGHRGIRQTIEECRRSFYFPGYQEIITEYVSNCSSCLQVKRAPESTLRPPLQPITAKTSFPGDIMELDLVGKLKPSGNYLHILTALDVFSQFMFAIPLKRVTAESIAQALVNLFLQHSYIPRKILTDKGTSFCSALVAEIAKLLDISLAHATVKHAQTIGALERRHSTFKKSLKIYENEQQNNWHHFVSYAVFAHNTTYNPKTRCCPAELFHGHSPDKPVELRFNSKSVRTEELRFGMTRQLQDRLLALYKLQHENLLDRYIKQKEYHDKKANAQPLPVHSFCMLLNPLYDTQTQHLHKMQPRWIPTYRVERRLDNENYLIRRVGTNFTQFVHRNRLRAFRPRYQVKDLNTVSPQAFRSDPTLTENLKEPGLLDRMRERIAQETEALPDVAVANPADPSSTATTDPAAGRTITTTIRNATPPPTDVSPRPRRGPGRPRKKPPAQAQRLKPNPLKTILEAPSPATCRANFPEGSRAADNIDWDRSPDPEGAYVEGWTPPTPAPADDDLADLPMTACGPLSPATADRPQAEKPQQVPSQTAPESTNRPPADLPTAPQTTLAVRPTRRPTMVLPTKSAQRPTGPMPMTVPTKSTHTATTVPLIPNTAVLANRPQGRSPIAATADSATRPNGRSPISAPAISADRPHGRSPISAHPAKPADRRDRDRPISAPHPKPALRPTSLTPVEHPAIPTNRHTGHSPISAKTAKPTDRPTAVSPISAPCPSATNRPPVRSPTLVPSLPVKRLQRPEPATPTTQPPTERRYPSRTSLAAATPKSLSADRPNTTPPQFPLVPAMPLAPRKLPLIVSPSSAPARYTTRHVVGPASPPKPDSVLARRLAYQPPAGRTSPPPRTTPKPKVTPVTPRTGLDISPASFVKSATLPFLRPRPAPINRQTPVRPVGATCAPPPSLEHKKAHQQGTPSVSSTPSTRAATKTAVLAENGPATRTRGSIPKVKPSSLSLSKVMKSKQRVASRSIAAHVAPEIPTRRTSAPPAIKSAAPSAVNAPPGISASSLRPTPARQTPGSAKSRPSVIHLPGLSRMGRALKAPTRYPQQNQLKANKITRDIKEVLVFREGPMPIATPGANSLVDKGVTTLPGEDVVIRFTTLERIEKITSKGSNRDKFSGGTPELGCVRKIYDKNSHRHTLNLVVAARDHPLTVHTLELALYNLMIELLDTVKRVHVPLDMRILKAIDGMSVVLAFEEAFLSTGVKVHIWNLKL